LLASAKRPLGDAFQSGSNFLEQLLLVLQQAQRELLFEIVGAEVRHVDWHFRQVSRRASTRPAERLIRQMRHVAIMPIAQRQQIVSKTLLLGFGHRYPRRASKHGLGSSWTGEFTIAHGAEGV